jgi:uncharacterized protein YpuA (DUF1002 family)
MTNAKKAYNEIVTQSVLINIFMESADYQKVQKEIKQKLNVDIPADELKKATSFYHLLQKIKSDIETKSL